jgi:hypothetical protein
MLLHIIETKELDRHWLAMEKKNEMIKQAARMAERDRKRLEKGSDYDTDNDLECKIDEQSDTDYDSEEDDHISNNQSKLDSEVQRIDMEEFE